MTDTLPNDRRQELIRHLKQITEDAPELIEHVGTDQTLFEETVRIVRLLQGALNGTPPIARNEQEKVIGLLYELVGTVVKNTNSQCRICLDYELDGATGIPSTGLATAVEKMNTELANGNALVDKRNMSVRLDTPLTPEMTSAIKYTAHLLQPVDIVVEPLT